MSFRAFFSGLLIGVALCAVVFIWGGVGNLTSADGVNDSSGSDALSTTESLPGNGRYREEMRQDDSVQDQSAEQLYGSDDRLQEAKLAIDLEVLASRDYQSALLKCQQLELASISDCDVFLLASLAAEDLPLVASELALISDANRRARITQALYRKLGSDPNQLQRLVDAFGEPPSFGTLDWIARQLAHTSSNQAVSFLSRQSASLGIKDIAESLGRQLAGDQFDAALAMADVIEDEALKRRFLQGVKRELARQDPLGTLTEWLSHQKLGNTHGAINTAFFYLAKSDPQTAFSLWEQVDDTNTRYQVVNSIIDSAGTSNFDVVASWVFKRVSKSSGYGIENFIGNLAKLNPQGTRDLANQLLEGPAREAALGIVAVQTSSDSPLQALADIATIKSASVRHSLQYQIFVNWARSDPKAAMEHILENQDRVAASTLSQVWSRVGGVDLSDKLEYLKRIDNLERGSVLFQLGAEVAQLGDRLEISALLRTQQDSKHYGDLLTATLSRIASADVDMAMQLAADQPSDYLRDRALGAVLSSGDNLERSQVYEIFDQLSLDTSKRQAISTLVYQLGRDDPDETLEWLSSMEQGRIRDAGVSAFVYRSLEDADDDILDLSKTISDPGARQRTATAVLFRMAPERGREALSEARSLGLSPYAIEQLQAMVDECERFGESAPECDAQRFLPGL